MELTGLLLIFIAIFGSGAAMLSGGAIPDWLGNIFQFLWGYGISLFLLHYF